jgi:hypothetical protein
VHTQFSLGQILGAMVGSAAVTGGAIAAQTYRTGAELPFAAGMLGVVGGVVTITVILSLADRQTQKWGLQLEAALRRLIHGQGDLKADTHRMADLGYQLWQTMLSLVQASGDDEDPGDDTGTIRRIK